MHFSLFQNRLIQRIESHCPNFSKSPDKPPNPRIMFVQIFLRIGGGQLRLRLHSPNSQITELEKFGELRVDYQQHYTFLQISCHSRHIYGVACGRVSKLIVSRLINFAFHAYHPPENVADSKPQRARYEQVWLKNLYELRAASCKVDTGNDGSQDG